MGAAAVTVAGVVVLVVGLRDMFHTLLHPVGQGGLSSRVLAAVWRLSRATGHRLGQGIGPAAMVAVILMWVALQLLGWALIYLPHVPEGFTYSPGIDPDAYPALLQVAYLSLVTLTTLGYGDMVATDTVVRAISPLQALTGFALLTAGLTWFTQIYPPLSRRRALAVELQGLAEVSYAEHLAETEAAVATRVLDSLVADVAKVRIDFTQHTEGFYFRESAPELSLSRQVSYLLRLRDQALEAPDAAVRRSGELLSMATAQLSEVLDANYLHTGEEPGQVFAAYARQHGDDGE